MSGVHLSFCVPTYNYGAYIATAIQSVLDQCEPDTEIVVLDGGSTDHTRSVVETLAAKHPLVRYVYQPERGGIDRDLARSVELTSGEYCWLLSADDALIPGALRRIMDEFERGHDILLANRTWCDASLRPVKPESWLTGAKQDRVVNISRAEEFLAYMEDARSLGALFSFMTSIGFRREAWMRARVDASLIGTNYAHVQRLFDMGRDGAQLKYIAAPLVLCRGGTDSFSEAGLASRLLIDLTGFLKLSCAIFPGNEALQAAFRAVMKREHRWPRWVRARSEELDPTRWEEIERLLVVYGFNSAQLFMINALGKMLGWFLRRPAS
jgi:abequosyltransferase